MWVDFDTAFICSWSHTHTVVPRVFRPIQAILLLNQSKQAVTVGGRNKLAVLADRTTSLATSYNKPSLLPSAISLQPLTLRFVGAMCSRGHSCVSERTSLQPLHVASSIYDYMGCIDLATCRLHAWLRQCTLKTPTCINVAWSGTKVDSTREV